MAASKCRSPVQEPVSRRHGSRLPLPMGDRSVLTPGRPRYLAAAGALPLHPGFGVGARLAGRPKGSDLGCRGSAPALARWLRVPECRIAAVSHRNDQLGRTITRSKVGDGIKVPARGHAEQRSLAR